MADRIIKARGLARHHFWGEYSAEVYVVFECEEDAIDAMHVLTGEHEYSGEMMNAAGGLCKTQGWIRDKKICGIWCAEKDLDRVQDHLESLGADRKKILSCAKSISNGEVFEIQIRLP